MHIFRFLQKYLIRFSPRLWPGHSKTFTELSISHSCCVLRAIVLLEGEPSAQSELVNALDWVFINAEFTLHDFSPDFHSPTGFVKSQTNAEIGGKSVLIHTSDNHAV